MVMEMINLYGSQLIGFLLVALFGFFGIIARNLAAQVLNTDTKQRLAKLVVQFVEQAFQELHGTDKLNTAVATLSDLLAEKGICATEREMKVLIEAAVAEFNDVFHTAPAEHAP